MDSDVFKFHLRKLVHERYVRKLDAGAYALTPSGKEFANNLSKHNRAVQKQPKLSMAIVASQVSDGVVQYLFQQRLRHPFYGFWGTPSGPVAWGESIKTAAQREFEKQTGLTATRYVTKGFYRKMDYFEETKELLEDKLFAVVEAAGVQGEIANGWQKGLNTWMTLKELGAQPKYFPSTSEFIDMLGSGEGYRAGAAYYTSSEY